MTVIGAQTHIKFEIYSNKPEHPRIKDKSKLADKLAQNTNSTNEMARAKQKSSPNKAKYLGKIDLYSLMSNSSAAKYIADKGIKGVNWEIYFNRTFDNFINAIPDKKLSPPNSGAATELHFHMKHNKIGKKSHKPQTYTALEWNPNKGKWVITEHRPMKPDDPKLNDPKINIEVLQELNLK